MWPFFLLIYFLYNLGSLIHRKICLNIFVLYQMYLLWWRWNYQKALTKYMLESVRHKAIGRFINVNSYSNVKPNKSNIFKTERNSSYMAFEWRKHLEQTDVASIQKSCDNSIRLLGCNKLLNIMSEKLNENYPITAKNPFINYFCCFWLSYQNLLYEKRKRKKSKKVNTLIH